MKLEGVRLVMVSLALVAATSIAAAEPSKQPRVSPLHCHLVSERKSGTVESTFVGVFELRNDTKDPISFEYIDNFTEHLDLDVRNPAGKLVPKAMLSYGDMYATIRMSNKLHKSILVLKPGEKYHAQIVLFGQIDLAEHPMTPGKYTIEAVFKWDGKEYRSEQLKIEVKAK